MLQCRCLVQWVIARLDTMSGGLAGQECHDLRPCRTINRDMIAIQRHAGSADAELESLRQPRRNLTLSSGANDVTIRDPVFEIYGPSMTANPVGTVHGAASAGKGTWATFSVNATRV